MTNKRVIDEHAIDSFKFGFQEILDLKYAINYCMHAVLTNFKFSYWS